MKKYIVRNCPCYLSEKEGQCSEFTMLKLYCKDRQSDGEDRCTIKRIIESKELFETEVVEVS